MKILGEKSLSSKVIIGLKVLFTIIVIMIVLVLSIIIKSIRNIAMQEDLQNNIFNLSVFAVIAITGLIALLIVFQFIKIFKNLKNNSLFCESNAKSLDIISNSCFIISACYLITVLITFFTINNYAKEITNYIFTFSIMLMIIFIISGIGIKVLNEIYKKAIEYKEENDFTI